MSARKAKRQPKAPTADDIRRHHASLREDSDGLLTIQRRLYVAKSQVRCAHALARAEYRPVSDIEEVLRAAADELQSIADAMGEHLPLWIPEVDA